MEQGPSYVYKCPNCDNLILISSLLSGNTFGAKNYSDGKQVAPMLQESPKITKCPKCDTIFWLNGKNEFERYEMVYHKIQQFKHLKRANFLSFYEYITAIDNKVYKSRNDEIYIRQRLWWCFNDRVRDNVALFSCGSDEKIWYENINNLLNILVEESDAYQKVINDTKNEIDFTTNNEYNLSESNKPEYTDFNNLFLRRTTKENDSLKITIAEIHRNLGNFEKCMEILNSIENTEFNWLKEAFRKECNNRNTLVFLLD